MNEGLLDMSYDAALRALDAQERSVEQLRSRTGILLAATSLTASFLGAQTLQHARSLGLVDGGALVALAVSVLTCVYVLLPKTGFVFTMNAPVMFESLYGESEYEAKRRLIYWLEGYWRTNQAKADELGRYFAVAAFALVVQLILWSVHLAATL